MSKYSIPAIDTPVYSNILGHYSKHKVRMVEQSIHAYRLPSWNSDKGVIFDYMNWSPTAFQEKFGITSYKTKLVDQEGNVSFFNSQREAISASGIHSRTFTRSVNITPPHYILSPTMEKYVAIFQDESVRPSGPRSSREKDHGQISPDHFDLHSIPIGKYILIDSTTLKQVGPEFDNSQEAARYIGYSNSKRVRRYINTYYELSGTGEFSKLKFHILKNPDTPQALSNSYQLLKFDSETNEKIFRVGGPAHPTNFNSLADILRYFDVYRNGHNWKQKYVDTGKPYKKKLVYRSS